MLGTELSGMRQLYDMIVLVTVRGLHDDKLLQVKTLCSKMKLGRFPHDKLSYGPLNSRNFPGIFIEFDRTKRWIAKLNQKN